MSQILLRMDTSNEMIVWFYYTQKSEPFSKAYNIRFKFLRDGLYIGGYKADVELAARKFYRLVNEDHQCEILQTFNSNTAKYIQPYYELINHQEYIKLRQYEPSTCVITNKKFDSLCRGIFGRSEYRPRFQLPKYFVFFYARSDVFEDYKRKVLHIASEIGNSLIQNITPMGITKYNGWCQSAEKMNYFTQSIVLNIRLFDAIWYFKFIDLKRFELINKVKLSIQKQNQYLLKISSYDEERAIQTKDFIINDLQQRCLSVVDLIRLQTNNSMLHYLASHIKEKIKSQKVKLYSPDAMILQANELDQQFFMDEAHFCQDITGQLKQYKMPVFLFCHPKDKERIIDILNGLLNLNQIKGKMQQTFVKDPLDLSYDKSFSVCEDKVVDVKGKSVYMSQFSIQNFNDPCPEYDIDEDEIKVELSQKFHKRHEQGNGQFDQKHQISQSSQKQSDVDKQSFLNQSLQNPVNISSLSQSSIKQQSNLSLQKSELSQIIQKPLKNTITQLKNYSLVNEQNGFSIVFYTCEDGLLLLSEKFDLEHFKQFWNQVYQLDHSFTIVSQTDFIKFEIEFTNDDKIPQDKLEIINGLDQYFNSTIYIVSANQFDDDTLKKMEQNYNCFIKLFKTQKQPGFFESGVKEDQNAIYYAVKIYHLMRSNIQAIKDNLLSQKYYVQMKESQFAFAQQKIKLQKVCISKNYLNYFWVEFHGPKSQLKSILDLIYKNEMEQLSKVQDQQNLIEKNDEYEQYEIVNKDNYKQYWMEQLRQIHNLILEEQELNQYNGPEEKLVIYTQNQGIQPYYFKVGQLYTGITQLIPGQYTLATCVMTDKIPIFQDTNCLLIQIIIKL